MLKIDSESLCGNPVAWSRKAASTTARIFAFGVVHLLFVIGTPLVLLYSLKKKGAAPFTRREKILKMSQPLRSERRDCVHILGTCETPSRCPNPCSPRVTEA
jgi:hypothetical protein